METEVIRTFNAELVSLYELRPPISKKKIVDITKAAMKAIKYYKHVVFGVEKFLMKCKAEYKIPGLYCIDSIIRQSRHQFKEKDVFGPRFAINMQATLSNLLNCKADDKLKVVRVLNLWKSHEIFDRAKLRPWLEYCRDVHGLETDVVTVEKSVKGDQADFSIYSRVPSRGEKRKVVESHTPLSGNRSRTPPLLLREPSDDAVEGGVSERETLAMLTTMGLDLGGMFTSDSSLLQKVNKLVNDKLTERRELDSKRQGNIKNLLSKEFDYSDEDDSGDDDFSRKLEIEAKPTELTKQQIIGMAEAVLREPDTKEEIQRMHTERISALSQAAAARVQAGNIPAATRTLTAQSGAPPITIPLNPITPSQTSIATVPPLSIPMPGQPLQPPTATNILSPRSAQQFLLNAGGLAAFAPSMPPPNMLGVMPLQVPNSMPAGMPLASTTNAGSRDCKDVDQDERYHREGDDRFDSDRDERLRRGHTRNDRINEKNDKGQERRRGRSRDRDEGRGSSRGFGEPHSKRSRRSRSRDQDFGDRRREHRRSSSRGRRGLLRGHLDRERSERDHNSPYRELERLRRKMGLPWPPKEGHVLIASCTLWLGRIPSNCTENEIRQAVAEAGEPSRISIIHSRACAYVTMKDRKAAFRVMDRMQKNFKIGEKNVKLNWGIGQGLKNERYAEYWDSDRGYSLIPHFALPSDLEPLIEGGHLEVESLPANLIDLYDEHGLKGKQREHDAQSTSNIQLPQVAPNMPSYQFPLAQPPRLPGTAPFLPHGMMPIPGIFPPGLPPQIGSGPLAGAAPTPKAQNCDAEATNAPSTPPQAPINAMNVDRMRVPGPNTFMSSSYNMPPPRFNASCGSLNLRGNRSGVFPGRSPFPPFRAGPPFGGAPVRGVLRTPLPLMQSPGVGRGLRNLYPSRHFPPPLLTNNADGYKGMQENRWRNSEPKDGHIDNSRQDEWDNNAMVPSSSHEEYSQPESTKIETITKRTDVDDSSNEPVTSTTHDDESAAVSGTAESLASEVKLLGDASVISNNDDLKTVTMNEDRMLEQAIVYGDEE
ncbi:unnamed protein product [Litomosoides sigmodontis]|uniref:CID domain-containing protein n=1 Tax=Litomosoides sigmodontis TaxID=42156 RepID=A0A3P6USQ6_LITSI|nr:unnamed protein product [Litomosoides sigmodontis]